jgi:diguanylate cyclase (GGDEF)-like protein
MKPINLAVLTAILWTGCLLFGLVQPAWPASAAGLLPPLAAYATAGLLAAVFGQAPTLYLAVQAGTLTALLHFAAFLRPNESAAAAVVLASSLYLPLSALFLDTAPEAPPGSARGMARLLLALSALPVCLILYALVSVTTPSDPLQRILFHATASWLPIPLPGLAAFLAVGVRFLRGDPTDAPRQPWYAAALLAWCTELAYRSPLFEDAARPGSVAAFATCAGILLIGSVLDAAWRHANLDGLTSLPSRRPFDVRLEHLQGAYALAVLDIDHFKQINDRFGHDTGDQVLRRVAACLRQTPPGTPYRYGGEEFVLICPDSPTLTDELDALRERIGETRFVVRSADRPARKPKSPNAPVRTSEVTVTMTVSIGVARRTDGHATPYEVLEAADRALYEAKGGGRNRVVEAG